MKSKNILKKLGGSSSQPGTSEGAQPILQRSSPLEPGDYAERTTSAQEKQSAVNRLRAKPETQSPQPQPSQPEQPRPPKDSPAENPTAVDLGENAFWKTASIANRKS